MEAEIWGRRIRAFRKLKGYTQEGFAKALGISVSILGEIERGNDCRQLPLFKMQQMF